MHSVSRVTIVMYHLSASCTVIQHDIYVELTAMPVVTALTKSVSFCVVLKVFLRTCMVAMKYGLYWQSFNVYEV